MANISIMFIVSLTKGHFLGEQRKRAKYSRVKKHTVILSIHRKALSTVGGIEKCGVCRINIAVDRRTTKVENMFHI